MQTKRETRGGARPNSGPKKTTLSLEQVKRMYSKAAAREAATGKSIEDILLDFIYDSVDGEEISHRERLASVKLWADKCWIVVSEGSDADKELGPSVYLPERRPDPAQVVQLKEA